MSNSDAAKVTPEDRQRPTDPDKRFAFGENWRAFLDSMDDQRIERGAAALRESLGTRTLGGKRFLDMGSGSGLFSLAAHRLGADVVSVDFDSDSVVCTGQLKDVYGDPTKAWEIHQGSALDADWVQRLGVFDVVYAWGVLHHTGDMTRAIQIVSRRTRAGGKFVLAIYNDQGAASRRWLRIKQGYHRLPPILRPLWVAAVATFYETKFSLVRLAGLRNPLPLADWRAKKEDRGMSVWHDWVDWVGGLPFEVATPDRIINSLCRHGFYLERIKTVGRGWGCNEYVFRRVQNTSDSGVSDSGDAEDPTKSLPGSPGKGSSTDRQL